MKIFTKLLFLAFLSFTFTASLFADLPEEIISEQVASIKAKLASDDIERAYDKTNVLLRSFEQADCFPGNVTAVAIAVYDRYIDEAAKAGNCNIIEEIESNLNIFSGISTSSLQMKLQKAKVNIQNQIAAENSKKELSALNSVKIWLILIFTALAVLFLLIFIPFCLISRRSRRQMKDFDITLRALAGMQLKNNQILLDALTDIDAIQVSDSSKTEWGKNALPSPEMTEDEKSELRTLALTCESLGTKIDKATNRKNNSKNVSELVYKLAVRLGLNQNTAKVYFCAAMVYDAGFLSLPKELLKAENLNEEQKKILQTHIENYSEYFGFVPKKYINIFEDAAKYHHENIDGSGYPEKLKENAIPQIARLIHVAESYVSLVSLRSYKKIKDKESAVKELESKPELYDIKVVKVLDSII